MAKKKSSRKTAKKPARSKAPATTPNFEAALEQAKLQALKELAYGASHEINNPLANIATRAQTLLKLESDPEKRRMLAAIYAQAMRAHEMIADLMLFARPPALNCSGIDLAELLNRVIEEMLPQALEQQTELIVNLPSPSEGEGSGLRMEIDADATQLAVALRALIQNSLEALGTGGRVAMTALASKSDVTIEVSDDGPGIPAEVRPHIFEPFYSGREAGRGLGFGLSKCWRIITDHGGTITVEKFLPHGAVFRVVLPRVAGRPKAH